MHESAGMEMFPALLQRCVASLNEDDVAKAERALEQLVSLRPDDPGIIHLRGVVRFRRQDWAGAARDFRDALARDPGAPHVRLDLAQALRALGKPKEAIPLCRQILAGMPDHLGAKIELAKSLDEAGIWTEAEQCYRDLLAQPEAVEFAALNLAILFNRTGRAREAEKLLTGLLMPA